MNAAELREKSVEQLNEELLSLLRDQFNFRMQKATGQLKSDSSAETGRRDIARIKTILN